MLSETGGVGGEIPTSEAIYALLLLNMYSTRKFTRFNNPRPPPMELQTLDESLQVG